LTRHKAASQNPDEEAGSVELVNIVNCAREESRDGPDEQTPRERLPWTISITGGTSNQADHERGSKSNDIGIAHFNLSEAEVFCDDIVKQGWKRVPGGVSMESGNNSICTYHDQNANKNPNHEKKNTRPYLLTGLRTGMERAFWFIGLISGDFQRSEILNPILGI
jgi:hypothetical protein